MLYIPEAFHHVHSLTCTGERQSCSLHCAQMCHVGGRWQLNVEPDGNGYAEKKKETPSKYSTSRGTQAMRFFALLGQEKKKTHYVVCCEVMFGAGNGNVLPSLINYFFSMNEAQNGLFSGFLLVVLKELRNNLFFCCFYRWKNKI